MFLVFDDIIYSLQRSGGISAYWSELTKRMKGEQVFHTDFAPDSGNLFARSVSVSFEHLLPPRRAPLLVRRYLPVLTSIAAPHIFHSSYYRYTTNQRAVIITTVHDFVYEYRRGGAAKLVHHLQKAAAVSRSHGVICVSETTQKDFHHFFPTYRGIVRVIPNGISEDFRLIPNVERRRQVLFVGGRSGYKNFDLVVDALSSLNAYSLIAVGGGTITAGERSRLEEKMKGRYFFQNHIPNDELNRLYNESHCLIYPSSHEGFGIPIVEATKAGCPVVAGIAPVFKEIAGDTVLRLQEASAEEIRRKIILLEDSRLRARLIAQGAALSGRYSWDTTAKGTLDFYSEVLRRASDRRASKRQTYNRQVAN